MQIMFGETPVVVDIPATREFHQQRPTIQCECQSCANYIRTIVNAPKDSLALLESLGVDPLTILGVETFQDGPVDGFYMYDCHSLIIGSIESMSTGADDCLMLERDKLLLVVSREPSVYMKALGKLPSSSLALSFRWNLPFT